MRVKPYLSIITLATALFVVRAPVHAQDGVKLSLDLRINTEFEQPSGTIIVIARTGSELRYTTPAGKDAGHAPGGVLFRVERVNNPATAFKIAVDSDGDGKLEDETSQLLSPDSLIVANVERKWANGRKQKLPYSIRHMSQRDRSGQIVEKFIWTAHYRAEGILKTKGCEAIFAVTDVSGDGEFDREGGTNIGVDVNGDKKIAGRDEHFRSEEIIEYCGDAFLLAALELDGSSVSLTTTALRVAKIGDPVPAFALKTEDGTTINSKDLRGRVYLLDFWASWCKPCVEKFDFVKQIGDAFKDDDLSIIAINVDDAAQLPKARQIVKDYRLTWPHVMSGQGDQDVVWKIFGGINRNRLAIPLYVLIDAEGRLRFAGNGGDDLSDVRVQIKEILTKKR